MVFVFSPPAVPAIRPVDVPADAHLLDVREEDEWAAGHIEGAQHIPIGQLIARLGELPVGDRPIVCVCRVGARSAQVTGHLVQQGIDAVNLDGGMAAWAAAGRPMVSETALPPTVI